MYRRPVLLGPDAWGVLLLAWLTVAGCPQREPFTPPDPFYLYATYKVGKNPTSVTTADFNQDGLTDLIVTNIGNDSLSILFGNGDGSFKEPKQLHVSVEPRALALSDYNGDGRTDIAVACAGSDQVVLFLGLAGGRFSEGQRYPVQRTPISIAAGDVNGDQKPDLVVALRNDKIAVLLGVGDGTFTPGQRYEYGDTPTSLALADLNQALQLSPNSAAAYNHRGTVYQALRQPEKALADWRKACELGLGSTCEWLKQTGKSAPINTYYL